MADGRADAYAAALFEIARAEGNLERVEAELFEVARAVERSDELRAKLTDQAIPVELRQGVVEDLLQGRAMPVTQALVSFIIGAGRGRDLPTIVDRMVERAAEARQEIVAEVRSAIPLNDDQRNRLAAALAVRTGLKVSVKVIVDASVLGGLVVQVGDTIIDGSVRSRLDQLRGTP
jgi:F-type H+-transporting ATPase subunit delta